MSRESKKTIVSLPGDGIGPEITKEALAILERLGDFDIAEHPIGGVAIEETGAALPSSTLAACRKADAILLGAVGGPRWDGAKIRPESGLLELRRELDLFANLRPLKIHSSLRGSSPIKEHLLDGVDIVFVRELTGGIYFGEPRERRTKHGVTTAVDTMAYSEIEIARVARVAFQIARGRRGRVTSVDKANVLESSRLWREVVTELAEEYPDVELEHQLVDSAAMKLIAAPAWFDVVLTGNMFGDILSDEGSVLSGSLGLLPSASLGSGSLGLYEPIHGSAPDIAGKQVANPIGTIASVAMMLRHSLEMPAEADRIEAAITGALDAGARTSDLGGAMTTAELGRAIASHL